MEDKLVVGTIYNPEGKRIGIEVGEEEDKVLARVKAQAEAFGKGYTWQLWTWKTQQSSSNFATQDGEVAKSLRLPCSGGTNSPIRRAASNLTSIAWFSAARPSRCALA